MQSFSIPEAQDLLSHIEDTEIKGLCVIKESDNGVEVYKLNPKSRIMDPVAYRSGNLGFFVLDGEYDIIMNEKIRSNVFFYFITPYYSTFGEVIRALRPNFEKIRVFENSKDLEIDGDLFVFKVSIELILDEETCCI